MITKELKSFLITAQAGSFQKAGEQLYISSTALIKQINALEKEIGISLFHRTNKGLALTEAGKVFYDAAFDIMQRYHQAIQAAKEIQRRNVNPIRFGISQINPHRTFNEALLCDLSFYNNFTTYIVPISSEYKDFADELRNLGTNVDFIPYFLGHDGLDAVCATFCLAKLPLCVAVPVGHPLFDLEILTYEDLNGHDLLSINGGANRYYKVFNKDIHSKVPTVNLHLSNYYDFNILNYAASCKQLVLAGAYLKDAHPLLKLIPVQWDHYLPYGLHYSHNPSSAVTELLQAFKRSGISGNVDDAPIMEY